MQTQSEFATSGTANAIAAGHRSTLAAGQSAPTKPARGAAKKKKRAEVRAVPFKEGEVWSFRVRRRGQECYETGFKDCDTAHTALNELIDAIKNSRAPKHGGPRKNTVGKCVQRYGMEHLPDLKGAAQEVRRMNRWLKPLGLPTLAILPIADADKAPKDRLVRKGRYFAVFLEAHTADVRIPNGLHAHRAALVSKSADSTRYRCAHAGKTMDVLDRDHVQGYIQALEAEGLARATVGQEQALLRSMFNHAKKKWYWTSLKDNPACGLTLTGELVERERVLSLGEQQRMDEALSDCRNQALAPAFDLLRETTMRASEPRNARWGDVDWDGCLLTLRKTKGNKTRKVPLSPAALKALRELGPSNNPDDPIFALSYESLKAAWRRACERAGIQDLHVHDLRHTGATRLALKTGNVFLVQRLTGLETFAMVERYVNVRAEDVVAVMHSPEPVPQPTQPQLQADIAQAATALLAKLAALSPQLCAQLAAAQGVAPLPTEPSQTVNAQVPAANDPAPKPHRRRAV